MTFNLELTFTFNLGLTFLFDLELTFTFDLDIGLEVGLEIIGGFKEIHVRYMYNKINLPVTGLVETVFCY